MEKEDIDLINEAWKGTLEGAEHTEYQNRLENDPEFAEKAKEYIRQFELLRALDMQQKITQTEELLEKEGFFDKEEANQSPESQRPQPRLISMRRLAAIAASIALLAIAGYFIYQPDNGSRIARYLEPYPDEISMDLKLINESVGAGGIAQDLNEFIQGMEYYRHEEYAKAQNTLESYIRSSTDKDQSNWAKFYLAQTYLLQKKYDKALTHLEDARTNSQIPADAVSWYLGLIAYQSGDKRGTLFYLRPLLQSEKYKAKAAEILSSL